MRRYVLQTLASVRDPSLLNANPPMPHKRDRQGDILDTRQGAFAAAPEEPRAIAGSQRASRAVSHVELIAASQLLHEQSITPQPDIQQHQLSRQPHQPLYDLPLNSNQSLDFLSQWSSSAACGIAQHVPNQVDSWLLSANTGVNTDTSYQTDFLSYHRLELNTLTPDTQTMAYNTMGTAMNDMQVMDRLPAARGSTANQVQRWHDSGPASSTTSSVFQFQDWAGRPGASHFEHRYPETSHHQQPLRQVRTGPSAGSPHAFPPQQDHDQRRHPQPMPTMHRRDAPQPPSPTFMEPLLNPQQQEPQQLQPPPPQQPAFDHDHNTVQMWANTHTASEYVSRSI